MHDWNYTKTYIPIGVVIEDSDMGEVLLHEVLSVTALPNHQSLGPALDIAGGAI